eukprot:evm.model.scf_2120EXC.4 EVM.evm.TU.scf_2120EXC.4   scf_2120EXC:17037-24501(+)
MRALVPAAIAVLAVAAGYAAVSKRLGDSLPPPIPSIPCDHSAGGPDAVPRFAKALTFPTISNLARPHHSVDTQALQQLHDHLRQSYATVWEKLKVEQVCDYSLLATWEGSNASAPPVLFVSHIDVVPIANGTEGHWTYPPFSGTIADGYVWGRGALDVKVSTVAILEAWSQLLKQGHQPERTLMLAAGHDEEVGGRLGAGCMSSLLEDRGVKLAVVLDEGTNIAVTGVSLIRNPVALVGTAEKGYTSLQIDVKAAGGHSSMPPIDGSTSIGILSRMISYMESHPPSRAIVRPVADFFKHAAPYVPFAVRPILAASDQWPLNTILAAAMSRISKETASIVTTTVAPTLIQAGVADNVLPQHASAVINFRTLPGSSVQQLVDYVDGVVNSVAAPFRNNITVSVGSRSDFKNAPSGVTDSYGPAFQNLQMAIRETVKIRGEVPAVVPTLVPGVTDSKHYEHLSLGGVLRFLPLPMNLRHGDVQRIHGTDERVSVSGYLDGVCTYRRIAERFGRLSWEE